MEKYRTIHYRDVTLRICLSIVAAHIMTHYDESDSFWAALFTASYWRSFIASFIIASILSYLVRYVSMRLDKVAHWTRDTLKRVLLQTVFGWALPCLLTLLLVAGYFRIFGRNILHTEYIKEEFIVACMMILVINVFYFGMSLFYQLERNRSDSENPVMVPNGYKGNTVTALVPEAGQLVPAIVEPLPFREVFIIHGLRKSFPVNASDIAYIYVLGGAVFLRTFNMEAISSGYRMEETMKELEAALDPKAFFRINRQMIISFTCCKEFSAFNSKTMSLSLEPVPYKKNDMIPPEHERLTVVSEQKAAAFKKWMQR